MGNINSLWGTMHHETSSRCVTESVTGAHCFTVTRYSLLDGMGVSKFVSSNTFRVDGHDWHIKFYPDGCLTGGHASVLLCLLSGEATSVKVKFSFSLLGRYGIAYRRDVKPDILVHTFTSANSWKGRFRFFDKSKLKDDCFTIRCDLTVIREHRTEGEGSIVVPIPPSNIDKQFGDMLKHGKGADVAFSVGAKLFHAHRCVLAARSSVFMAQLYGHMKENTTQRIEIKDTEPYIFEALLHYIYTDSLPDKWDMNSIVALQHLLVATDRYGLDRLRAICEGKLCQNMNAQTVATTLALAEQHRCVHLKNACLAFLSSRSVLAVVKKTDGFNHLVTSCPLVMMEILDKIATSKGIRLFVVSLKPTSGGM